MKKVVITGGTGAVGVALIKNLTAKGIEVLVIAKKKSKRIDRIPQNELVKIVFSDLDGYESLLFNYGEKYDIFYHLAWEGTFGDARNDLYLQNRNVQYTLDAVSLAKKLNCGLFIGAGSQAEYGSFNGLLSFDTPVNPESGYGVAKLCAGQMSRIKCRQLGIKHIWTRILSVYGPYDGENTLISLCLRDFPKGISPEFTPAEQIWDYLYSSDCANALYLIALNGKNGQIYTIGSGQKRVLKDYIEEIKNIINPELKLKIGSIPYSENQIMHLCADISELTKDTGWVPQVSFKEGIEKTIKWIKEK